MGKERQECRKPAVAAETKGIGCAAEWVANGWAAKRRKETTPSRAAEQDGQASGQAAKPAEERSTERPAEERSTERPAEERSTERPAEERPTERPAEERPTERPAEERSAERLAAGLAAGRPSEVCQAGRRAAGGFEAARQARRPAVRQAAAERGALEAAERLAGPVGPVALSCPLRTGPSPAAQAAAVGFGPYWVQTAQEGSAHRCALDPSVQLFGILGPNTTAHARPRPSLRRPWAGDCPGPPSTSPGQI